MYILIQVKVQFWRSDANGRNTVEYKFSKDSFKKAI